MRDHRVARALSVLATLTILLASTAYGWEIANPWPLAGNISSVASPSTDTCWIADDYGGIAVTADGGNSWRLVELPEFWYAPHLLAFNTGSDGWIAENPRFAGETGRFYHTTDGGGSWNQLAIGNGDDIFELAAISAKGDGVFAGGFDYSHNIPVIYRLVEGAFERVSLPEGGSESINDIFTLNGRSVWVAGSQGYFAFSANGGAAWQKIETGTNRPLNAVAFRTNMVGWIGGGEFNAPMLLKTVNGGGNWTPVEGLDATSAIAALALFGQAGAVAVTKGNGDDGVASTLVSNDGSSWNRVSGIANELYSAVDAVGSEVWATGQKGLLMHSANGGDLVSAGHRLTTKGLTAISFDSPEHGWAVGEGRTVLRTVNGGETWTLLQNFPGWNVIRVVALSATRVIATCADSREFLSTDGGDNWHEIAISDLDVYLIKRYGQTLIAASEGSLLFSDNAGDSWTAKRVSANPINDFSLAGGVLFAGLSNDAVMRSEDLGDHWSRVETLPENCEKIHFFDQYYGWALINEGVGVRLYVTRNGGGAFTRLIDFRWIYDWAFVSQSEGWIAGVLNGNDFQDHGLLHLTDYGFDIRPISLPVGRVSGVVSANPTHLWMCGSDGLLARLTDEVVSVTDDPPPSPFALSLIEAYPNPTNGQVTLNWNARLAAPLTFDLIGINGRSGKTYVIPTGASRFGIELSDLPAGTYYLKPRTLSHQPVPIVLVK